MPMASTKVGASNNDLRQISCVQGELDWTTHPRTKGSTGYPDKIKDTDYFRATAGWGRRSRRCRWTCRRSDSARSGASARSTT